MATFSGHFTRDVSSTSTEFLFFLAIPKRCRVARSSESSTMIGWLTFFLGPVVGSNVAYHGDLEKKAAMEKQRSLAGENDTLNGHDNASSGIPYLELYLSLIDPPSPKKKRAKRLQRKPHVAATPLISKIKIPAAFVPKPPPPVRDWRTGRVWKRPGAEAEKPPPPPNEAAKVAEEEEEEEEEEEAAARRLRDEKAARYMRYLDNSRRLYMQRWDADQPTDSPAADGDEEEANETGRGEEPDADEGVAPEEKGPVGGACTYCLGGFGLFMAAHVPCRQHRLTHILNDYLLTSSFQHLMFWA